MLTGIYSSANSMLAAERNQDVIARNLAHASMPGFRRSLLTFSTTEIGKEIGNENQPRYGVHSDESTFDFRPGPVKHTGRPLDLAIQGDGFFEVETTQGLRYTRKGVFLLNNTGDIVNADGMKLQGTSGPINIPPNVSPEDINITANGTVFANGQQIAQIKIAEFEDNADLRFAGTTLFSAPAGVTPTTSETAVIQQRAQEGSNVNPVNELVRMLVGMRHHQASQKSLDTMHRLLQMRTQDN